MGYYTRFTIYSPTDDIPKGVTVNGDDEYAEYTIGRDGCVEVSREPGGVTLYTEEPAKWYSFHDDMLELSRQNPGVRFVCDGEGEENDDIWRTWYLNGERIGSWSPDVTPPEDPPGV